MPLPQAQLHEPSAKPNRLLRLHLEHVGALERGFGETPSLEADERVALEKRWFESLGALVGFLLQQQSHAEARIAAEATRLALGELLAWVEVAEARGAEGALAPGEAMQRVVGVETLLQNLGRRRALERVVAARRPLAAAVEVGTHAGFEARRHEVERVLQARDLPRALELAEALHRDAEALADDAYPGAAYDRGVAPFLLGRVLHAAGAPNRALPLLDTARERLLRYDRSLQEELRHLLAAIAQEEPAGKPLLPIELKFSNARPSSNWRREEIYGDDGR